MIADYLHAQQGHHPVEALAGYALEGGVGGARGAHAVDYVVPRVVLVQEAVYRLYVVLQVGVHRYDHIGVLAGRHQPGQQRVLMPAVAAELYAAEQGVGLSGLLYQLPGAVARAVVHQHYAAVGGNAPAGYQRAQLVAQPARGFGQYFFLVVARHHNVKPVAFN